MPKKAAVVENPSPPSDLTLPIASSICWDCKSEVGGEYHCQQCVKVQPLSKEGDYFECFDIPRLLNLDLDELETHYYKLSRIFHPDFFQNKTSMEQSISLGNSAVLNTAYQTLKNPTRRVQYLLELEAGTRKATPATPPADLFEELMDIQDDIIAFKQASDPHGEQNSGVCDRLDVSKELLEEKHNHLSTRLKDLSLEWDRHVSTQSSPSPHDAEKDAVLTQIRKLVSDQSYITRVLNDINALRSVT